MANYNLKGFFTGKDSHGDCVQYSVNFVPRIQNHWPWVEVQLAGSQPFVVQYETTKTPFEPIRKSRASINVVASEYFMDLCGSDAQHTMVTLINTSTNQIEWCGWLTNNLMNMPQDGCMETFTLEAIDCISSLEYFDYQCISGKKQVVSFQQILSELIQQCTMIETLYVDSSIQNESGQTIHMDELFISEQNFFSSDTDEPWTMYEVLEELCRFCGYTAVQWKNEVYLFDPQAHTPFEFTTEMTSIYLCQVSSGDFTTYVNQFASKFYNCVMTQDDVMGTGADISLETVYNTVTVKDSFYEIGDFVPDVYEDEYLYNRLGEDWRSFRVTKVPGTTPRYVNKRDNQKNDASEASLNFYQRPFWHKWYENKYYRPTFMQEYVPDTISYANFSHVKYEHPTYPTVPTGFQGLLNVWNRGDSEAEVTVDWKAGETAYTNTQTETIQPNEFFTFNWEFNTTNNMVPTPYFRINNGEWNIWNTQELTGLTRSYVAATVLDLGTSTKANSEQYNYEAESEINFERYLVITQHDRPSDYYSNPRYSGFTTSELNHYFKPVFHLTSGWTKPIIIDDQCYLTINASCLFERYTNRDYINSEWTGDCTGIGGDYNVIAWDIFHGDRAIQTVPPALVFKLGIGNYWWNGSEWTTTERPFYVNVHTPVDDDGYIDFSSMWNTKLDVINNVSWTDFTDSSGYKIPLKGVDFDFNSDIKFDVCLPAKIQVYQGNEGHDGMNSYCWLENFKVDFVTLGQEKYDLSDIVYENVIDEMSVNELSDITLKFTTYPNEGQHSYSNVGYSGHLIDKVIKVGLDGEANKMEENLIKEYVNQYSTNTISQNMVLNLKATPISRIKDTNLNKFFHVCGQEIDYAKGTQRVNMIESKIYNTNL